jgi:hypothetical protein
MKRLSYLLTTALLIAGLSVSARSQSIRHNAIPSTTPR